MYSHTMNLPLNPMRIHPTRSLALLIRSLCRTFIGSTYAVSSHWFRPFKSARVAWLGLGFVLLLIQPGQAQSGSAASWGTAEVDSSRGYWRVKTQAATRSTLVQFFGPYRQLLYEEKLPEKWVRLSRKNQRQFDRLLAQLTANQLVTSRIKTEVLPPTPDLPVPPVRSARPNLRPHADPAAASCQVNVYVGQANKLNVIVVNPDRRRYKIALVDAGGESLYEEFANFARYRYRIDISALSQAVYRVIIRIDNQPITYQLRKQQAPTAYRVQLDGKPDVLPDQPKENNKAVVQ
jgi:hypothetical protein